MPGDYILTEIAAPEGYDRVETEIKFNVAEDGKVTLTGTYSTGEVEIKDGKIILKDTKTPVEVKLTATKTLKGGEMTANEFSFQLYKVVTGKADELLQSVPNKADGTVEFTAIKYTEVGEYTYKVKEQVGDETGITYDDTEYTVTVKVTSDKGKLSAATTIEDADGNTVTGMSFENTKTVTQKGTLVLKKTIKGSVTPEEADGALTFTVTGPEYPNGKIFTIGKDNFKYNADTKEYVLELDGIAVGTYMVQETTKDIDGNTVTVKYSIDGADAKEGVMAENIEVTASTPAMVEFDDTYASLPITVSLEATKTLTGATLAKDEFEFTLTEGTKVLQTKKNDADGKVKFDDLTFTETGVYTYKVAEVAGNEAGIT